MSLDIYLPSEVERVIATLAARTEETAERIAEKLIIAQLQELTETDLKPKGENMVCKHIESKDNWVDNLGAYQKQNICKLSGNICQGSDGVCSMYEEIKVKEKPEEQKETEVTAPGAVEPKAEAPKEEKKMPEEDEEKPEDSEDETPK